MQGDAAGIVSARRICIIPESRLRKIPHPDRLPTNNSPFLLYGREKKSLHPMAGHRFFRYNGGGGSVYRPRLHVDTSGTRMRCFSDVKNRGYPAYGHSSPHPVSTNFRKRERSPIRAPFGVGEMSISRHPVFRLYRHFRNLLVVGA